MAGSVCFEISQCLTAISEKFHQARLHLTAPEAASATPHTLPDKARLGVVGIAEPVRREVDGSHPAPAALPFWAAVAAYAETVRAQCASRRVQR